MKIRYLSTFKKHYKKRIQPNKNINLKFKERVRLFAENPQNPILKNHKLTGKWESYRAFWIGGDIRVTYKVENNIYYFYDIGSHNQVY